MDRVETPRGYAPPPQEETIAKMFQHVRSNPDDLTVLNALAEELEDTGRRQEAGWIRSNRHKIWKFGDDLVYGPGFNHSASTGFQRGSHPHHTEDIGEGPWESMDDAHHFARAEVGVPWSLVPEQTGEIRSFSNGHSEPVTVWKVKTAPYKQSSESPVPHSPTRNSRVTYPVIRNARSEYVPPPQEEVIAKMFDHLIRNPTDQAVRNALAEELDEKGQSYDAKLLRMSIEDKSRAIRGNRVKRKPLSPSDSGHTSTALWSSGFDNTDDSHRDIHPDTLASMLDDWHRFRAQHRHLIEAGRSHHDDPSPEENAAHDFWLSRNGHGAGFFDTPGQYGGNHDLLQEAARKYGDFNLEGPEPQDEPDELPGLDDDDFDDRYDRPERDNTITGTSYVNTDNEPNRMSRIKYAAKEQVSMTPEQEESALLHHIASNPDDVVAHHAYAEVLDEQGRHGEAAFHRLYTQRGYTNGNKTYYNPTNPNKEKSEAITTHNIGGMGWLSRVQPHGDGYIHFIMGARPWEKLEPVLQLLHKQKILKPDRRNDDGGVHSSLDFMNYDEPESEEPVRHSAYRAPKGGAVVRGTYYQGGKLIPDLEGDFANPPAPEPVVQYPQPKPTSLRDRLKAKFGRKEEPLVVSYARPKPKPPEHLPQLFDAVRRLDYVNPNLSIRNALAEELRELGRHKEAELLDSGRFAIDLNGGGKVVKATPPRAINTATRRGFAGQAGHAGIGYQQLREQLDHGRTRRIGNNREITNGPDGDIHVYFHGNHVVTAHPNGDYSLFTQGWHSPTTFAVHREITGHSPNRHRNMTLFMGDPFVEGTRINRDGEIVNPQQPPLFQEPLRRGMPPRPQK